MSITTPIPFQCSPRTFVRPEFSSSSLSRASFDEFFWSSRPGIDFQDGFSKVKSLSQFQSLPPSQRRSLLHMEERLELKEKQKKRDKSRQMRIKRERAEYEGKPKLSKDPIKEIMIKKDIEETKKITEFFCFKKNKETIVVVKPQEQEDHNQ